MGECDRVDLVSMAFERCRAVARGHVLELDSVVARCRRKRLRVVGERYRHNPASMALERLDTCIPI